MSLASLCAAAVERLDLDLSGCTVVTEAASGPYVVTPVLAALAGAEVYAHTRATRYGTVEEVFTATRSLLDHFGVADRVHLIEELTPQILGLADVITNSGHLRPLNADKLQHARDSVVVPLMYEAWEWRDADVDLAYLRSRGIRIGATNERHPDVDVFGYLGEMAVKQIHDAGRTVYRNRFVLVCNNDFGPYIAKTLAPLCDGLLVIDEDGHRDAYAALDVDWAGGFPKISIPAEYRDASAVILAAYPFDSTWVGEGAAIAPARLSEQLAEPFLLRYVGDVDTATLGAAGVAWFPEHVASGHMGVLPSAIGPDSIVRLQSGGLKVAELLRRGETSHRGLNLVEDI